ncbi:tRNA threonylcarbamoyladenosine dehydratase [Opitutaceae bacterium]|nr:tRNA threonylcarbamoyladenosine dehydratase [Opitutaceae bacterium]
MSDSHTERFGGIGRLYGAGSLGKLAAAHVAIVGLGGVGSWTVEGLARSGIGRLTLIDLDDVCVTNTNRQLPALEGNLGRPKAEALAERVRLINPECQVEIVMEFLTAANADRLLAPAFDVVVDAIDGTTNKADLIAACTRLEKRCVTVGGAGGKRDATRIRAADLGKSWGDDLLKLVRKKLRRDHGFARGEGHVYGVRCVYSDENPTYPWADGTCQAKPEPGSNLKLDCASGFGTAVWMTGAMGLAATQEAVDWIVKD